MVGENRKRKTNSRIVIVCKLMGQPFVHSLSVALCPQMEGEEGGGK